MARPFLAICAVTLAWAGCSGDIGDGNKKPDDQEVPGLVTVGEGTMHRLNVTEYRNTVSDLLHSSLDPAANFPADDIGLGFDNIASILTVSPLQVELYERAATDLAEEALAIPQNASLRHVEAESLSGSVGSANGSGWNLTSNGEITTQVTLDADGDYVLSARVYGQQAGPDPARASLLVDGLEVGTFDVPEDANNPAIITQSTTMTAGNHTVGVAFLNDYYMPPDDRNLVVDWIELEGPLGQVGVNPTREEIVFCDIVDPVCREDVLTTFATRAWRRPATADEVAGLEGLVQLALDQGDDVNEGLELAVKAVLLSSHFIFRPELDDDPTSPLPHTITAYELASRLSYFLWSSMPDEILLEAAASGELDTNEGVAKQVQRMLAHDRASALVDNFAGQWLLIRALDNHVPDYATFAGYDDTLKESLRTEMRMFFAEYLKGELPMNEMLTAGFTFLNDRLATHYGIPFEGGAELEKVSLEGNDERFGLLTMGSLLTVTSLPTRTSPVKRGVWVLENLLCDGPPAPPPGVEALLEAEMTATSLRERLAQHRADPACASCHNLMDPIGLGLEHYDGIGAFRTQEAGGATIDSSSELDGMGAFQGARDMAELLQDDPRFSTCLLEKLFIYALGRDADKEDEAQLELMNERLAEADYRLPAAIEILATSIPFRMRRGAQEEETKP
ncbi:MAG: DUF1592 domain-containing protein [Myxococcales bacterium]|nr:DUF1592 domain-containing protein [Myxococcales bacterium]